MCVVVWCVCAVRLRPEGAPSPISEPAVPSLPAPSRIALARSQVALTPVPQPGPAPSPKQPLLHWAVASSRLVPPAQDQH